MKLEINNIITLKDNKKYIIISDTTYEGIRYFALVGVLEDESNINNEYLIAKEVIENDNIFIEDVTDQNLIDILIPLLEIKEV